MIFQPVVEKNHPLFNKKLAYAECFKRPASNPVQPINMYTTSREYRTDGTPKGAIIELDWIVRPVQLIPRFGKQVEPGINKHNSIDEVKNFWINPFHDMESYRAII